MPDDSIFTEPASWPTPAGEVWRVFGRKLKDGYVVVGISPLDQTADMDTKLRENAAKFGSTVVEATAVHSREIDSAVDYAEPECLINICAGSMSIEKLNADFRLRHTAWSVPERTACLLPQTAEKLGVFAAIVACNTRS